MKLNQRGIAEVVVLYFVIGILAALFIPNPVSSSLGVGIRPNKTVQITSHTEKLVPIATIMVDGKEVPQYKTVADDKASDQDIQQHVTFWEWLRSLPFLVLLLMGAGVIFPGIALFLHNLWTKLKTDTKKIVDSIDAGLAVIKAKDAALHQQVLDSMSKVQGQNSSTEALVTDLQQKK